MKQYFILLASLLSTIYLGAQEQKMWTLNDCVLYAVAHNSKVNTQQESNSIYHQDYLEAIGKLLPNINANTSAGFNFGRAVNAETNSYADINSFSNNYALNASLTLFDGLANYTRVRIGRINKVRGKEELEDAKDMIAYETMEAFYNVQYNNNLVSIATEQLGESENNHRQIKRMEELGIKGVSDVAEAEVKVAEDTYSLTKQQNICTISIIQLKEKMNFPIDEVLIVAEEITNSNVLKIIETPIQIYNGTKDFNPKAKAAESYLKTKKLNYKASKGVLMPSLSVGAGLSTNFFRYMDGSPYSSFSNQFKNKRGEYISFTLSIPIFSGFSRSASVKRAKSQMYIAEYEQQDILRKLYSDIEQAIADTNGQADEYHQAVKQRESATIAHKINTRKYEEGLIDPILLHTSSNRLMKAKADEFRAKYMYQLKYKLVNYYKGEAFFIEQENRK